MHDYGRSYMVENSYIFEKISQKIDKFDTKIDRIYDKIGECRKDINICKIDIQGVQKDLTNHLNNKKEDAENFNRKMKIAMGVIGIIFTTYVTIKELL